MAKQLPMFPEYDAQRLRDLEAEAIALLQEHEPEGGYALAFSGGKDSCVIKWLADNAGVDYSAHYSVTTVDPPELVRFIRQEHPDVQWERKGQSMWQRIATAKKVPPTRLCRWCCSEYKETGMFGRGALVIGVRSAESAARAANWQQVLTTHTGPKHLRGKYICPILEWTDGDLWSYIHTQGIPYCSLYDEGMKRLGCVGCPLAGPTGMDREFARWPKFETSWRKAVEASWEKRRLDISTKTGEPVFQGRFPTAESFWLWWRYGQSVPSEENCQAHMLWTNEGEEDG